MSTKIYDGLIATDKDVFLVAKRIRETLEPKFLNEWKKIAETVKTLPDTATWNDTNGYFYGKEQINKDTRAIFRKIVELNRIPRITIENADIMYSVVLVENNNGGNPLVLVFGSQSQENIKALIKSGVVEDYGYWNNTDEPEDVTEEEWEERRKAWSLIYNASPSEVGLLIESPSNIQAQLFLAGY